MPLESFGVSLSHFIEHFGYWGLAIVIFLESTGLPLPAESLLIAMVLYSAKWHHLDIKWIAFSTIIAAIMGDNLGYLLGLKFGSRSVRFFCRKCHIKALHFVTAQFLFRRYGGLFVLFGRFFALMRITSALLAGSLKMPWKRFLLFNVLGALIWGSVYTFGIYYGGQELLNANHTIMFAVFALLAVAVSIGVFLFRRYFNYFTRQALDDLSVGDREQVSHNRYPD